MEGKRCTCLNSESSRRERSWPVYLLFCCHKYSPFHFFTFQTHLTWSSFGKKHKKSSDEATQYLVIDTAGFSNSLNSNQQSLFLRKQTSPLYVPRWEIQSNSNQIGKFILRIRKYIEFLNWHTNFQNVFRTKPSRTVNLTTQSIGWDKKMWGKTSCYYIILFLPRHKFEWPVSLHSLFLPKCPETYEYH